MVFRVCLFCESRVTGINSWCGKCHALYAEEFGPEWYKQEWAKFMIKDNEREFQAARKADMHEVSLEALGDDELNRAITPQPCAREVGRPRLTAYDTVLAELFCKGMGYKLAHRELNARFNREVVSLATVKRRLREFKRGVKTLQ